MFLTAYLLYWLAVSAWYWLGNLIRMALPAHWYWPGMGLVAGLGVVFGVGLLMHAYVVQRLFAMAEEMLYHVPLIKSVYRAIRDFFDFFSPAKQQDFNQVVAVSLGDTGMEAVGFVTEARTERLPADLRGEDNILVYFPLSYMIGGYAVGAAPQRRACGGHEHGGGDAVHAYRRAATGAGAARDKSRAEAGAARRSPAVTAPGVVTRYPRSGRDGTE